jgi:hypothetical protein
MHEMTRRYLCRLLFVILCVVPALAVLGFALYRTSPLYSLWEQQRWQRAIEIRIGLNATIQRVSHPRSGVILLAGVSLFDPDTQERVLFARLVEVTDTSRGLAIALAQPEVERGQFVRLWEAFHDRILRSGSAVRPTQLVAHQVTLHDGAPSLTFNYVRCGLEPTADEVHASLEFDVAGLGMPAPAQIQIVRNRRLHPPTTGWELRTGSTPLPCSLWAAYCPALERLGTDGRFSGTILGERSSRGWNGELAGEFTQVDLARVIEPFPHKLSGTAAVRLRRAVMRNGRVQEAAGSLEATGGVISHSLVASFSQAFRLDAAPRARQPETPLHEYERLVVEFQLDDQGLCLKGQCEGETAGVLLTDRQGPLLVETGSPPVPAMALAQAVSPETGVLVPATSATHLLLLALPLPRPDSDQVRTAERPGYTPLRFTDR